MNLPDFQLPVPTNPPDAGSIIGVIFGADWIPVILSALELLRFEELWISPPADLIPQIDELMSRIQNPVIIQPQTYPKFWLHFHKFSLEILGSAVALSSASTLDFASAWFQPDHQQYDQFRFYAPLAAGNHTFSFHGTKSSLAPIISIFCDGNNLGTIDLYASPTQFNATASVTINIPTDGNHQFDIKALSRNALSTDYYVVATAFSITKQ